MSTTPPPAYDDLPPPYEYCVPGVQPSAPPQVHEPYTGPVLEQWVEKVKKFSSQYDQTSWNAGQLCGQPKVYPNHGDLCGSWATGDVDANQFAEVEFARAVEVIAIEIYETYHAGGTKRIAALNENNQWVTLWETDRVTVMNQARIFSPPIQPTDIKTKNIRVEIDCTVAGTWVEIDAIKLVGKKENADPPAEINEKPEQVQAQFTGPVLEQWVERVKKFSSEYDQHSWCAGQLCGQPKVYPSYGDKPGSWATGTVDANQFAEVEFARAVEVVAIEIYETYHAGGTKRIAALNENNQWVTLWETDRVTVMHQARIFSPPIKATNLKTKNIRVEIDCTVAGTWVEIDAIKLIGKKENADPPAEIKEKPEQVQAQFTGPVLEQWVERVKKFSSEYDQHSWCAGQLCGQPKVYPSYGDQPGSWATSTIDANQFAEVEFARAVEVVAIEIYETYHAGGTKRIAALNENNQWVTLWETDRVTVMHQARIFSPPIKATNLKTKNIRVEIDCTVAGTWVEIDAIKLIGKKENADPPAEIKEKPEQVQAQFTGPVLEQWVERVKKFSSEYDQHSWCAGQLCGQPKVYPSYGDQPGSWATSTIDANQFAEVEFARAVEVVAIEIYETYHAGGTKRIAALNENNQWVTLWETDRVTVMHQARIFSPPIKATNLKTKNIRVEIDCTVAGTWVEIDAIKLIGKKENADPPAEIKEKPEQVQAQFTGPVLEQWVERVKKFSSEYDQHSWCAGQLCGQPKVYPSYGDQPGSWATSTIDANQFAEVEFARAVEVVAIEIYETYHAGGTKRIAALNENNQWVTLWETDIVTVMHQARIFSPPIKATNLKTKNIRVEIDCTVAGTWVEIDAIKLIGKKENADQPAETKEKPEQVQAQYTGPVLEQWVERVKKFSSEYDQISWCAGQLCGQPKVYPSYGDKPGSWATGTVDANQFAEVEFARAVEVVAIEIYETYHAGGTKRIAALNENNQWVTLWETDRVTVMHQARIFSPPIKPTNFKTKCIRLEMDCTAAGTWVEIDAIKLIGKKDGADLPVQVQSSPCSGTNLEQWVEKVNKYSSQYDNTTWNAGQLRGEPKVYPHHGDHPGTWATETIDANQFAEVEFARAVEVIAIEIYETYHAGGTKRIAALNENNQWVTLWETDRVTDMHQARIFSPPIKPTSFKTKCIRIEIDCTAAGTWVEIDAIKLIGKKDTDGRDSAVQRQSTDSKKATGVSPLPENEQWVKKVKKFSSQYDDTQWNADFLVGAPRMYPNYGDMPQTWATGDNTANEFVELEFEQSMNVSGIQIYETYNAGAVKTISALNEWKEWIPLWQTGKVSNIQQARIFSPAIQTTDFKVKVIRIDIDCTAADDCVEIDAVKLIGEKVENNMDITEFAPVRGGVGLVISQWIEKVNGFSSQYGNDGWSANMICGEPKIYPNHKDSPGAWAPNVIDGHQFIEVEIETPLYIFEVDVYETYNAGGVRRIAVKNSKDQWVILWETHHVTVIKQARIFKPKLSIPAFRSKHIRIELDLTAAQTWVELDAIKVKGTKKPPVPCSDSLKLLELKEQGDLKKQEQEAATQREIPAKKIDGFEQWVKKVKKFSSQYDTDKWSAKRVCGEPKVYPKYGDIPGAWAPANKDNGQFLEVKYKKAVEVIGIEIYETFHAGGVVRIQALNPNKGWDTLWKTEQVKDIKQSRILSPPLKPTSYKTKNIRIEIDCTVARTWVEIDAIKLIGTKELDNSDSSTSSDSEADDRKKLRKTKKKKKGEVQSKGCSII